MTINNMPAGPQIGKQTLGSSNNTIYDMATKVIMSWNLGRVNKVADIGGGQGNFARILLNYFEKIDILEHEKYDVNKRISYHVADLNDIWPVANDSYDACVSLEVIEHLENPRFFMREMFRILRPNGKVFISMPNQLSFSSKLSLVARNYFRDFSDNCYPGHITALVEQDLRRCAQEAGFTVLGFAYSNHGRIPFSKLTWQRILPWCRGRAFSDSHGICLSK